jgi:hypothetical protein
VFQLSCSQALDDLAVVSPAFWYQRHAAFATHFFWRALESFRKQLTVFTVVFVGSVD